MRRLFPALVRRGSRPCDATRPGASYVAPSAESVLMKAIEELLK